MKYGPWKILGLWFSVKLDHTPLRHAAIALALCLLHPLVAIVFYFSKEMREGQGNESCVGFGKCLQGFGLLDFGAPLAVALPYWFYHLPTLL